MHLVLVFPHWTIPTYPFIYFGNIDLSTCRLAFKFPEDMMLYIYICQLSVLPKLICRLVDLSTCRPVELVLLSTTKIQLGLGLVCG